MSSAFKQYSLNNKMEIKLHYSDVPLCIMLFSYVKLHF